jgi:hypothetical protein
MAPGDARRITLSPPSLRKTHTLHDGPGTKLCKKDRHATKIPAA